MNTEDYVSYPIALALKACGFDEPCRCCYVVDKDTESNIEFTEYASRSKWNSAKIGGSKYLYKHISAPTLAHAQKWLREKCGLHVVGLPCMDSASDADGQVCDEWQFWFFDIMQVSTARFLVDGEGRFDSYEQALSEGIKSALELIKKGD